MGKATLDLPDTLEHSAKPLTSTDDLLSQMAGDEIDRLLAEAEVEPVPGANEAAATNISTTLSPDAADDVATDFAESTDIDKAEAAARFDEAANSAAADHLPARAAARSDADESIGSVLNGATDSLRDTPRAKSPEHSNTAATPHSAADALAAELEADEALHAAGLSGSSDKRPAVKSLKLQRPGDIEDRDIDAVQQRPTASSASALVAILVKPLELLNRPMDSCPDALREGLGWVGIVTFLNAVAVLLYVLVFRHR